MKLFFSSIVTLFMTTAFAADVQTFCGVRAGSFGNAYLIGSNGLELAQQGGNQTLLTQADDLIAELGPDENGEVGMQNGSRYCLEANVVAGEPKEIVSAWRMGDEIRTFCGVRGGSFGNAYLSGPNGLELAQQGGDQTLLTQADDLIAKLGADKNGETGMQNGSSYCVNAKVVADSPVEIVSAYRM